MKVEKENKEQFDSIYAIGNGTATILWIAVMVFGAIFHDRWWIWIFATIIWFNYITRHWDVK